MKDILLKNLKNAVELGNTKNMRETLSTVIEYLKVTLGKNTIKFLGMNLIFTVFILNVNKHLP
jgi:hypothetical protein